MKEGRQGIFADLNSVELERNRISLGGPVFCGPGMSENILSAFFYLCCGASMPDGNY